MSLVVPSVGNALMLKYIVNFINLDGSAPSSGADRLLRLYSNNLTPNKNTVYSDLTEVDSGTGYTAMSLIGTDWEIESASGVTSATYNDYVTFNFSSSATVYGFYITTQDDELLWVERFENTYTYPTSGELKIIPYIALD